MLWCSHSDCSSRVGLIDARTRFRLACRTRGSSDSRNCCQNSNFDILNDSAIELPTNSPSDQSIPSVYLWNTIYKSPRSDTYFRRSSDTVNSTHNHPTCLTSLSGTHVLGPTARAPASGTLPPEILPPYFQYFVNERLATRSGLYVR